MSTRNTRSTRSMRSTRGYRSTRSYRCTRSSKLCPNTHRTTQPKSLKNRCRNSLLSNKQTKSRSRSHHSHLTNPSRSRTHWCRLSRYQPKKHLATTKTLLHFKTRSSKSQLQITLRTNRATCWVRYRSARTIRLSCISLSILKTASKWAVKAAPIPILSWRHLKKR